MDRDITNQASFWPIWAILIFAPLGIIFFLGAIGVAAFAEEKDEKKGQTSKLKSGRVFLHKT